MKFSIFSWLRSMNKEKAQFILARSSDDKIFIAKNGMTIHTLLEFRDALASMSDETFSHHVNEERNDFSAWIRDVHHDDEFADMIQGIKDRNEAFNTADKRLAYLKRASEKG